jgi:pimeloyl-ACP methyl ester carboxylesterase
VDLRILDAMVTCKFGTAKRKMCSSRFKSMAMQLQFGRARFPKITRYFASLYAKPHGKIVDGAAIALAIRIDGMRRTIRWKCGNSEVTLAMDEAGNGASVVLLPALSSISTREEMLPLVDRLSSQFRVSTVDWPGFGGLARPREDWSPDILSAFLDWFLSEIVSPPHAIVAAGHAATYALHYAVHRSGTVKRLVLIAPTWRGPLPTMMEGKRPWFTYVRAAISSCHRPAPLSLECQPFCCLQDGARACLQ